MSAEQPVLGSTLVLQGRDIKWPLIIRLEEAVEDDQSWIHSYAVSMESQ